MSPYAIFLLHPKLRGHVQWKDYILPTRSLGFMSDSPKKIKDRMCLFATRSRFSTAALVATTKVMCWSIRILSRRLMRNVLTVHQVHHRNKPTCDGITAREDPVLNVSLLLHKSWIGVFNLYPYLTWVSISSLSWTQPRKYWSIS